MVDESQELAAVRGLAVQFPRTPSESTRPNTAEGSRRNSMRPARVPAVRGGEDPFRDGGERADYQGNVPQQGPSRAMDSSFLEMRDPSQLRTREAAPLEADTVESPEVSEILIPSRGPTPPARIDMRHRRIPTADLAPLDVFRDRFSEQRQARQEERARSGRSRANSRATLPLTPSTVRHGASASMSSFFPDGENIMPEMDSMDPPRANFVVVDSRRTTPSPVDAPSDSVIVRERSASVRIV